ncbi:MAG: AMP-binding protein [Rhodospirillaceae bacterium]|nr:AMP-binding protein [Rhodospirillaceae bacterium]MBT6588991.1 AMP-binding protein [Rhodospirillaceae bacterium]
MDIRSLMRRAVQFNCSREAIVHGDIRLTFEQSWQRGLRLANALLAMGLKPGDRVGSLEDNGIPAADFFVAAAVANLVRVPLYPRNKGETHVHMLGHTGCRAVIAAEEYVAELDGLQDQLPALERIITRDDGYEDWLAGFPDTDPDVPVDPDDYFIIRHTGGTTGLPKGVAYTHRAWLAAGRDWMYLFPPIEPGDRCLHIAPISHGSGYFFVPMWLSGAANVLLDHFDATATMDAIENEQIQYLFIVPAILNMMNRDPKARSRDFSKLKCMQVGAAPIADDTALTAREIFGDVLWQGYGQTEAVPVTMMGPRQWFTEIEGSEPLRSCGLILPFADVEIWDDNNKPLAQGKEGQISVRCDGQMAGFWDDEAATAERVVDGWVLTGDIGMIDRNGYLYLLDRAGDMIVSGGYNIYPAELENVLSDHDDVVEAAVFAVPDERWGETPMAVCTVIEGAKVTAEELIGICADALGSYKRPKAVELTTDPLPKSIVGKVQRKVLREPYWEGHERRIAGN